MPCCHLPLHPPNPHQFVCVQAARKLDGERLTQSLSVAHNSLRTLEQERSEQATALEQKEQELEKLRAKALAAENAVSTQARHSALCHACPG